MLLGEFCHVFLIQLVGFEMFQEYSSSAIQLAHILLSAQMHPIITRVLNFNIYSDNTSPKKDIKKLSWNYNTHIDLRFKALS